MNKETLRKLESNKLSPFIGNKNANKIIYEFFDYSCSHCKEQHYVLEEILKEDSDLKIVLKTFPIFEFSQVAARAIIAASLQNKTKEFNDYLFQTQLLPEGFQNWGKRDINSYICEKVILISEKLKMDVKKFENDMILKKVDDEIVKTKQIAHEIGIHGTPSFVISGEFFIGMMDKESIFEVLK